MLASDVNGVVVYIISTHFGTFYTGITNHLIRRWSQHVSGKSSYLRRYKARSVIWVKWCESRSEARLYEVAIKRVGAKKWLVKEGVYDWL